MLNQQIIQQKLLHLGNDTPLDLYLFETIDSTNRFLKTLPPTTIPLTISCCIAEMQTAGRGRFGRAWYSPFAENIYCSVRWRFTKEPAALSGLSLVVSLSVVAMLANVSITQGVRIKWPNDILWNDKKLSGVLIEIIEKNQHGTDVVIGIGLNVNSNLPQSPDHAKPWCSLIDITGQPFDRNELLARLIDQLQRDLTQFNLEGFSAFITRWKNVDYLVHKRITVSHHTTTIEGKATGINNQGQLLIEDPLMKIHVLSSGDPSLMLINKTTED